MNRILTLLFACILLLTSVFCFMSAKVAFISVAFVVGIVLILSGAVQGYIEYKQYTMDHQGNNLWIIQESIVTVILGILVLCDQLATDAAAPLVFGIWAIAGGSVRLVIALLIGNDNEKKKINFRWTLLLGCLCIVIGVISFMAPSLGISVVGMVGAVILVHAICIFEIGFHMPHGKDIVTDIE